MQQDDSAPNYEQNPRYKCISAFSLRGSYRISDTSGKLKMGYKFTFTKNKGKNPG